MLCFDKLQRCKALPNKGKTVKAPWILMPAIALSTLFLHVYSFNLYLRLSSVSLFWY